MASYLDKAQVNSAITDNTKLDLGHQHITTTDFMQLNPSYLHEMVPGEKIDVKMESFARLNPLPVPTFGRASLRSRAFFVPFRTIFRGWNDFITDSIHVSSNNIGSSSGLLTNVPLILMSDLLKVFFTDLGTSITDDYMMYPVTTSTDPIDFILTTMPTGVYGYNLTVKGRQCYKILESLGYKLDLSVLATGNDYQVSAMPLLALAKVYVDWYWLQQYSNVSEYDELLSMCNCDVTAGPIVLTPNQVRKILVTCSFVSYDSDYFVSAWDQPNSPNVGNYSNFKLVNIDSVGSYMYGNSSVNYYEDGYVSNNSGSASVNNRVGNANAPFISPYVSTMSSGGGINTTSSGVTPISEYLLHGLHALTDYMKRHQLAGSRAFDRYLARFGKALPAEKLNRCNYLGASVQDIQIGDVMSTGDTANSLTGNGAQLGAYAGKGISYGNAHFDFSTDEYGYFIVLTSLVPATGYFQGMDRQIMRTTKLQFWTPEFDSLGVQPITADELYVPQDATSMTTGNGHTQIFGFTPRYADYKVAHDQLTGNFRLRSINGTYNDPEFNASDSWHLMRTFDGSDFSGDWANVVHGPGFVLGKSDWTQYKRIFYNVNPETPDNFTVIHNFEIAAYAPMKALYDTYEFEDKGKKVTLDVNGVKMN